VYDDRDEYDSEYESALDKMVEMQISKRQRSEKPRRELKHIAIDSSSSESDDFERKMEAPKKPVVVTKKKSGTSKKEKELPPTKKKKKEVTARK
jgi:hypothetical protein